MITLTFDDTKWRVVPLKISLKTPEGRAMYEAAYRAHFRREADPYGWAPIITTILDAGIAAAPQPEPVELHKLDDIKTLDEMREHADRLERGDIPLSRGAAILREAVDQMHGFFVTRDIRRAELERLYAVEKSFAAAVRAENEACAEIVKTTIIKDAEEQWGLGYNAGLRDAFKAIRARMEKK